MDKGHSQMKRTILIHLVILLYCSLSSCEKVDEFPIDIQTNDFVWKGLNAYYLYQDEINDLSDRRFNNDIELERYLREYPSPEVIFNALAKPTDGLSSIISDYNTLGDPIPQRTAFTSGFEFAVIRDPSRIDSVVGYGLDVLPLSYASTENIDRGDFFYAVLNEQNDTIQLTEDNYEDALLDYPQDTLKLLMADYDGLIMMPNGERVDLVREQYQHPAIQMTQTFDFISQRVGYLMYNNDFSGNYSDALNTVIQNFKSQSVNELIIDLRYNVGGGAYDSTVAELASMITGQFENQVLIKETWNNKAQQWFELNQPDSLLTYFPRTLENGVAINGLHLTDVYIVLNGNGFEGNTVSELLINSLKPYINVHVIGNTTNGENRASITLYDSPDYNFINPNANHTYALQPVVLSFSNSIDETYDLGLSPTIAVCPTEDPLNLGVLGENSDPILNSVLNYITTGSTGNTIPCNPFDFEVLYHSIDQQRLTDNRIFTRQKLPDLGR